MREVGQEPERGAVRPMDIIDHEQQAALLGEVRHEPEETV